MSTPLELLSVIAPAFDELSETQRQAAIDAVTPQVASCQFGADYELAIAYLAASLLTQAVKDIDATGEAVIKREGDLQVQYGLLTASPWGYTDKFGRAFEILANKHIVTMLVANSGVSC